MEGKQSCTSASPKDGKLGRIVRAGDEGYVFDGYLPGWETGRLYKGRVRKVLALIKAGSAQMLQGWGKLIGGGWIWENRMGGWGGEGGHPKMWPRCNLLGDLERCWQSWLLKKERLKGQDRWGWGKVKRLITSRKGDPANAQFMMRQMHPAMKRAVGPNSVMTEKEKPQKRI